MGAKDVELIFKTQETMSEQWVFSNESFNMDGKKQTDTNIRTIMNTCKKQSFIVFSWSSTKSKLPCPKRPIVIASNASRYLRSKAKYEMELALELNRTGVTSIVAPVRTSIAIWELVQN